MNIQAAIQQLINQGQRPNGAEAYAVMRDIMSGEATPAQIAAYLVALRFIGETPDVISGSARAMREACTPVATKQTNVIDTCGTGGDGANTFNISTCCAFVTAGAGVPVAKHGNRSVSSNCGSADVLSALGVDISVGPDVMTHCLDEIGIAFLFAPSLHPAMKHAIGPRREIGVRTLFNVLGPLTNPAGAKRGVMGVYSAELVPTLARALADLGAERYFVVHGNDGLDEITTTTFTTMSVVDGGEVKDHHLDPTELGIEAPAPGSLAGGDPAHNATIIRSILDGETGPRRDIVILNAAAAIVAGGKADDLIGGLDRARESIDSGGARDKLERLADLTS